MIDAREGGRAVAARGTRKPESRDQTIDEPRARFDLAESRFRGSRKLSYYLHAVSDRVAYVASWCRRRNADPRQRAVSFSSCMWTDSERHTSVPCVYPHADLASIAQQRRSKRPAWRMMERGYEKRGRELTEVVARRTRRRVTLQVYCSFIPRVDRHM